MEFVKDFNKEAIIYKETAYSYKEVIRAAKYFSSVLKVNKGDRVVNFIENKPEFIFNFFGVWNAKAIPVNVDASYDAEELEYVLSDCDPKYILTSTKNYETAKEAVKLSGKTIEVINTQELEIPEEFEVDKYSIESPNSDDTGVLLYTSGTTGKPKGVILTFDNLMSNVDAITEIKMATPEDRLLALLPYHHVLPLSINLLMAIHIGTLIVLVDDLSASAITEALKKHKITIVVGVPRLWEMIHKGVMNKIKSNILAKKLFKLCEKINNEKFSKIVFKKVHEAFGGNIRFFVSGGAKIDPEILNDFNALGIKVLEGYGLTETSPIIAFNRENDVKNGTVGKLIPGVKIKIESDGELVVKGRNVMKGYYNKPEATAAAIDEEGWFHTGDLAKIEDGYISIIGRKKEMIVLSNGKNINPLDIESEILKGTDIIQDIAIVEHNNHLLALVYPDFKIVNERKITNITETLKWEIVDSYNVTAPKYRKILEIKIVKEELPKTKLGKIRRFMLKDLIVDDENLETEEAKAKKKAKARKEDKEYSTVEFKALYEYIKKEHGEEITPDSHIEIDLGLDSLDVVEMNAFIEKTFGFEINEEEVGTVKIIRDICEYIRKNSNFYHQENIDWKEILLEEDVKYTLPKSFMVTVTRVFLTPVFAFYLRLKKKGLDKISKDRRIYICNHESFIDAFAVGRMFDSSQAKETYFFAIKKHFENPIMKYMADHGNIVLVDINKNLKESLQIAAKVLKSNKNLVIFPEGARTRDGELQNFKKFFAILSKELNIPITVFGIDGTYEAMPYGTKFFKSNDIRIEVLGDVYPEKLSIEDIVEESKNMIFNWKNSRKVLKTKKN
ncbi:AMP-binding protein [Fusobacterium sp. MFO224]|uniref:AMP-binding protein n=1 Tax=Fusobacterium sp. MFO224 TaxID=3378070 RepID=UPI0038552403